MKKIFYTLMLLLVASNTKAELFKKTENGIKTKSNKVAICVEFYTPSVVRVLKTPENHASIQKSLSVTLHPEKVNFTTTLVGNLLITKSDELVVTINLDTAAVSFASTSGKNLLQEQQNGSRFTAFNDSGANTFSVSQSFSLDKNEPIYGLGQHQEGSLNQRNMSHHLEQGNREDAITFFQSVKGYGVFWDNYSPTEFIDSASETSFTSIVGDSIDYYFMFGGNADGVIADMRKLTGQAPMFPLWTFGFWQSKERYKSQAEIVDVVRRYRELNVPLDGVIQDWQYWGNNYQWNAMEFLNSEYPSPKKMVQDIHDQNAHMIISIWSSFGPKTKPFEELKKGAMLFDFSTWPESAIDTWPPNMDYPSGVKVYDAYNPKARDIYWKYAASGIFNTGVDGWWMDSTEPDHLNIRPQDYDTQTYFGSFRKVRNAYPLMAVGGVYDHQRKDTSNKRVFILTRSAFAGQQRYGANTWSGDVVSSWDTLRKQIPTGLNFSLSGIPYWNSDIGGFFAESYKRSLTSEEAARNPFYQELYVRWLQFGAFTPMMRSHGTDIPREIYHFGKKGEPIYDAIDKFINLRYSLLPYIYSESWGITHKQSSLMRALFMDFSNDKSVWNINNQYMFGKSILVAPIVNAQYTGESQETNSKNILAVDFSGERSTNVYLPADNTWYDFWNNEEIRGGQNVVRKTTIDTIPIFVRAGSILPIGPRVQYAKQVAWDQLEIRVYPGASGSFVLYEDEFDNYNYEKGAYSEIPFIWNDATKELLIEKRIGSYKGMLKNRKFIVVLPTGLRKVIDYDGNSIKISCK